MEPLTATAAVMLLAVTTRFEIGAWAQRNIIRLRAAWLVLPVGASAAWRAMRDAWPEAVRWVRRDY